MGLDKEMGEANLIPFLRLRLRLSFFCFRTPQPHVLIKGFMAGQSQEQELP